MTFIIIDATFWAHAAHATMPMLKRADGHHIGATFGFARTLLRFLARPPVEFTHIVACFDKPGETWRHRVMPAYKANRTKRREGQKASSGALSSQWPMIEEAAAVLGVKAVSMYGTEADDIVATYARLAVARGMDVVVVSPDKDLCQLIRPGVRLWNCHPSRTHHPWQDGGTVFSEFGVLPEQIPDFLALVGDVVDGIPGVPNIGPMRAAGLIREHGGALEVLAAARAGHLKGAFATQLLMSNIVSCADQITKARTVATTHDRIDLDDDLEGLIWRQPDFDRTTAFMESHGFDSLLRQIEGIWPGSIRTESETDEEVAAAKKARDDANDRKSKK